MNLNISKKGKLLLLISGLFTLGIGLANVFVNIFLWKKSNDFILIAKYNLMHYFFIPLTFTFAGWISKRKNGIWALRFGLTFFILFFISILYLQNDVLKYVYLLGILFGIASGFYWLSFNVLCFDFTCTTNRDSFFGYNGSFIGIANAVSPFIAAYIIEKSININGYTIVFSLSLIIFVILIIISFFLKCEEYGKTLDFKKIFKNNNKEWQHFKYSIIAWGLRDVIMFFIISILIYKTTGSEIALGKLTLYSYLLSSISYVLEQRFIKPKRRLFSMHMGAIFMFIAVIGLAFNINYKFLVLFILLDAFFFPFFIVPVNSATFNILCRSHEEKYRVEYIINKDIALNIGRIISITILITFLKFIDYDRFLNYYLLFLGSAQFISLYYLRKIKTWKD